MPRIGRIYQKALCYHVMNRGVNRNIIFVDEDDHRYFSKTVAEYKELCDAKVYHWVWMGNHYHMLVEVAFDNLRSFVGGVQQAYAQYHHARHNTSGVFWQGRFKSKPVETGPYLISCGRYIERNPVRAGLAEMAQAYPWSSARTYVEQKTDTVTDQNSYIGEFSEQDRSIYAEALMSGIDDAVVRAMEGDRAIGTKEFATTLKRERGRHRLRRGPRRG